MLIVSRRPVTSTVRGQACNKIHKVKTVSNFVKKEKLFFLAFANVNKVNKLIKTKMNFMSFINFSNFIYLSHVSKWAKIRKTTTTSESFVQPHTQRTTSNNLCFPGAVSRARPGARLVIQLMKFIKLFQQIKEQINVTNIRKRFKTFIKLVSVIQTQIDCIIFWQSF